jgi:hypothetical protein
MQDIGSVLHRLSIDLGFQEKMLFQEIEEAWQELFGKPLSLHTCPSDLKEGELTINVDSPVWLQQLKFLQPMILKRLEKYPLKSVRLRLGKIKRKPELKKPVHKPLAPTLSRSDSDWLNKLISDVSDTEIRESIKKAVENSLHHRCKITKRGAKKS